jgi:hypothetical protein
MDSADTTVSWYLLLLCGKEKKIVKKSKILFFMMTMSMIYKDYCQKKPLFGHVTVSKNSSNPPHTDIKTALLTRTILHNHACSRHVAPKMVYVASQWHPIAVDTGTECTRQVSAGHID